MNNNNIDKNGTLALTFDLISQSFFVLGDVFNIIIMLEYTPVG